VRSLLTKKTRKARARRRRRDFTLKFVGGIVNDLYKKCNRFVGDLKQRALEHLTPSPRTSGAMNYFNAMGEYFESIGADLHSSYDSMRRSRNRAASEARREKSAASTGIITERDAALKLIPKYVYALGERARVLDVGSNAIESVEEEIGNLKMLKTARLDGNALARLPRSFTTLVKLRTLVLRGNKLKELPEDIGNLVALEELDVSENALTRAPKSLSALKALKRFAASSNCFRNVEDFEILGTCAELEEIDLSKNLCMRGHLPVSWGCLVKLKEIDVDGTDVEGVASEIFLACNALQTLSMRNCVRINSSILKATDGFEAYEARRQNKHDKQLSSRVLLDESRLDQRLPPNRERAP